MINMTKWKIIDNENIADIKTEIYGKNRLDLLNNIIEAFSSIITDYEKIDLRNKIKLKLTASNFEELVFNFVEKLIIFKDTRFFLPKEGKLQISNHSLSGFLLGSRIESGLLIKIDIKAVAHHKFKVEKNKIWKAVMVFDI